MGCSGKDRADEGDVVGENISQTESIVRSDWLSDNGVPAEAGRLPPV
jgi:hypothetical protein